MTRRHIHYEAAFEDFLRSRGLPYVPVDETRKTLFAGAKIKSFDFLVYRHEGPHLLVDIKGRKFPYDSRGAKRYWENWVTREDLEDLSQWQDVFGDGFEAVLVFAYWLTGPGGATDPTETIHPYRGEYYAFLSVRVSDYVAAARRRSPKWDTVMVPTRTFRKLARSLDDWVGPSSLPE